MEERKKKGTVSYYQKNNEMGRFLDLEQYARNVPNSPFCHTLHYGGNVFEGIRAVYDENEKRLYLIALDEHVERLMSSMRRKFFVKPSENDIESKLKTDYIFLDIDRDYIKEKIISTIRLSILSGWINHENGCYIRPNVYRAGHPEDKLGFFSLRHDIIFEIMAFEWKKYVENPRIIVYPEPIECPLRKIKAGGNYSFGSLGKDLAVLRGYDGVLFVDKQDCVLEGGGENVFAFFEDEIATPSVDQSILPGITRNVIIQMAKNLGHPVNERLISLKEFFEAEAAAFSGTGTDFKGITSVSTLVEDVSLTPKFTEKEFDLNHPELKLLEEEYENLISGKEIDPKNTELRKRVRTLLML